MKRACGLTPYLIGLGIAISFSGQPNVSYDNKSSYKPTSISSNMPMNGRDYKLIPAGDGKTILVGKTYVIDRDDKEHKKEVWRTVGTFDNGQLQKVLYELNGPISQASIND